MKTWKITLEYDGTNYSGWQEQSNARTVTGQVKKAAAELFGMEVQLHGAGRTDAGVHALAQVAHLRVETRARIPAERIQRELNERLPADIAILQVEEVANRFHARHDALRRSYVYQVSTRKNAFSKRHVWWVKEKLDISQMQEAAALLEGRHDFCCFRAPDPSKPGESTIVVVDEASVEEHESLILIRMEASHFLWRMVRRIVGVLVKVGKGELSREDFERLLAGDCDVRLPVSEWTAPAAGLFLECVQYPEEIRFDTGSGETGSRKEEAAPPVRADRRGANARAKSR